MFTYHFAEDLRVLCAVSDDFLAALEVIGPHLNERVFEGPNFGEPKFGVPVDGLCAAVWVVGIEFLWEFFHEFLFFHSLLVFK
jgi:hypothetical protein